MQRGTHVSREREQVYIRQSNDLLSLTHIHLSIQNTLKNKMIDKYLNVNRIPLFFSPRVLSFT